VNPATLRFVDDPSIGDVQRAGCGELRDRALNHIARTNLRLTTDPDIDYAADAGRSRGIRRKDKHAQATNTRAQARNTMSDDRSITMAAAYDRDLHHGRSLTGIAHEPKDSGLR
jgi:hypothetical protein